MKRLISILSAACILFSLGTVAWAEEPETLVIDALSITSNQQGKGFYDNRLNSGSGVLEKGTNNTVCLRNAGEWCKYDISALSGGTYQMKAFYLAKANVYFDVMVDGMFGRKITLTSNTSDWNAAPKELDAGAIYIAPGSKTLTVKNSSKSAATFLQKIILTKINNANVTEGKLTFYGDNAATKIKALKADGATADEVDYLFYDKANLPSTNYSVFLGTKAIHNAGDWTEYDVSAVPAGNYKVTVNAALGSATAATNYKISMGTIENPAARVALAAGKLTAGEKPSGDETYKGYEYYKDNEIGEVYISDGDELLRLENVGSVSAYVGSFALIPAGQSCRIDTAAVSPNVHGEGFYDNSGNEKLEVTSGIVTIRSATGQNEAEWTKYNVSYLDPGTYELFLNYASRAATTIDVGVDAGVRIFQTNLPLTNSLAYDTYQKASLGKIYLGAKAKTITIRNSGFGTFMSDYLELVPVCRENTADIIFTHKANDDQVRLASPYEYNIADVEAGVYELTATVLCKTATSYCYSVDAEKQASGSLATSENAEQYTERTLKGFLVLKDTSKKLTLENATANTLILQSLVLKRVSAAIDVSYSSDETGGDIINSTVNCTDIYAKVRVAHEDEQCKQLVVIHALYNGEELEKILGWNIENVSNGTFFEKGYKLEGVGGKTVKTMVWKVDDLNPLGAAGKIS